MATRTRHPRTEKIEARLLAPVNWLEERSERLVGGLKYFLFRKVPAETNWFHARLGDADRLPRAARHQASCSPYALQARTETAYESISTSRTT